MTKVYCEYTSCIYNSSCCVSKDYGLCKKTEIELISPLRYTDIGELECSSFEADINKVYECMK